MKDLTENVYSQLDIKNDAEKALNKTVAESLIDIIKNDDQQAMLRLIGTLSGEGISFDKVMLSLRDVMKDSK